jgi:hypothetical protein
MASVAGNIIRVAARHLYAAIDENVNVHHFNINTQPGTADDEVMLEDLATLLSEAYASVQAFMPTAVDAYDITVYNISQDYPVGVTTWTVGYTGGTSGGDGLPPGTAPLVLFRTATKNVLGKTFLPSFIESEQSNGMLVSGAKTACLAFASTIRDTSPQGGGYGFTKVVWSNSTAIAHPITSQGVSPQLAYQRRRKIGVGS